ncbi:MULTISPECIES: N-6 DNA methylase [Chromobacterium]|uniref:N-6 DNA methylase n=1 Tax=Chromobacterium TaxID=535 RepID=UPI001889A6FB|nr:MULTISPECIES: N-6 DNA methylase [Chromobacterium]QOZ81632.1 SAM-dependent DNA methyltransferase [Chromobacterium sp. Rain0013]WON85883.1 N-6 DNA methylase [Chromobacterium haemolyticum]
MTLLSPDQLEHELWASTELLREQVDLYDYKNHVFGLFVLKRLHDVFVERVQARMAAEGMSRKRADGVVQEQYGVYPQHARWPGLQERKKGIGEALDKAVAAIEEHHPALAGVLSVAQYQGHKRLSDEVLHPLMNHIGALKLGDADLEDPSRLGEVCEGLVRRYAAESGKRGGAFSTPAPVSQLLLRLAELQPGLSLYDPSCGAAGTLLDAWRMMSARPGGRLPDGRVALELFGQEKLPATWAMAKLCAYFHGVEMSLELGDTLVAPKHLTPEGWLPRFDRIVAQLPFTVKNWWTPLEDEAVEPPPADGKKRRRKRPAEPNYKKLTDEHKRFGYGIPPRSFGDYAFVQHVLATLKEDGRAALVMPHDVLFRDGDEGRIRNGLLFGSQGQSGDRIEGVIALPPALFYGSGMPTCVVVLNKNKPAGLRNKVIIVDASKEFGRGRVQNTLRQEDIEHILRAYRAAVEQETEEPDYLRLVGLREIKQGHRGNLNVQRYFAQDEAAEVVDPEALATELAALQEQEQALDARLAAFFTEEQGWRVEEGELEGCLALTDEKLELLSCQYAAKRKLRPSGIQALLNRGYGTRRMGKWSPHQSFKPSPLGVIPGNWEVCKLGELAAPLEAAAEGELLAVTEDGGWRRAGEGLGTALPPNAFAFDPARLYKGALARNADDAPALAAADQRAFALDEARISPAFLECYRQSEGWRFCLERLGAAVEGAEFGFEALAEIPLPVPPLSEQRKLVEEWARQDEALLALQQRLLQWQARRDALLARFPSED